MTQTFAIIDIGSNAVRLSAYPGEPTGPINIKKFPAVLCEMARAHNGPPHTLHPEGVKKAKETLEKFCQTIRNPELNVTGVVAVATEALRGACDGPDFLEWAQTNLGLKVHLLSEEQEGRYGALGVLTEIPDAKGIVADLGGGSLQLTAIDNNHIGSSVSFPLGTLRLLELGDLAAPKTEHDLNTRGTDLQTCSTLYVMGGSWRSLAKVYQARSNQDPQNIRGLEFDPAHLATMAGWMSALSLDELKSNYDLEPSRAETLPLATHLLLRLHQALGNPRLIVTKAGIRDGLAQAVYNGDLKPDPVPTPSSRGGGPPYADPKPR